MTPMYSLGVHKGRNLAGRAGLFPQSYTSSAPPAVPSSSDPSASDETSTPHPDQTPPVPAPAILLNGEDTNVDGEVMTATMTDVQKAIEQLGRGRGGLSDAEDSKSFSFASTGGGVDTENETDTDFEMSGDDGASEHGERDHKRTRQKLAEKARQALADAERLEMIGMTRTTSNRSYVPPIQVELSDESEDDEEEPYVRPSAFRRHSHIPEEDEESEHTAPAATLHTAEEDRNITDIGSEYSNNVSMPDTDVPEPQTATATRATFPPEALDVPPPSPPLEPKHLSLPSASLAQAATVPMPQSPPGKRTSTPLMEGYPSPVFVHDTAQHQQTKFDRSRSVSGPSSTMYPASHVSESFTSTSAATTTLTSSSDRKEKPPSDWTLTDVVEWLKSKGFDEDVCDKFNGAFSLPSQKCTRSSRRVQSKKLLATFSWN